MHAAAPVVSECGYAEGGVLAVNAIDVAGSGVVHALGGVAALVGAYIAGPRIKTPMTPDPNDVPIVPLHSERSHNTGAAGDREQRAHSIASDLSHVAGGGLPEPMAAAAGRPASRMFIALGAFIMWYSFYGFNLGALGGIIGRSSAAGRIMMVTTIGGMCGAVTAAALGAYVHRWELSISNVCNGATRALGFGDPRHGTSHEGGPMPHACFMRTSRVPHACTVIPHAVIMRDTSGPSY